MVTVLIGLICQPGVASADFLLSSLGFNWTNNPPAPGPIDRIDTYILAGGLTFSTALVGVNAGTVGFSNANFTGSVINGTLSRATSATDFTGTMTWNYNFAGAYSGAPFTLGINYYNNGTFVISETYTYNGSGSWTGGSSGSPVPIPGSLLLLGTGLVGLVLVSRRRQKDKET
jgi:hypothetical protein